MAKTDRAVHLTFAQVQWLMEQYRAHLTDQYPELIASEDLDKVKEEAEGFSEPDPGV